MPINIFTKKLNRIIIGASTVDDGVSDLQTDNPIRITGSTSNVADHNAVAGSVLSCARTMAGSHEISGARRVILGGIVGSS